MSDPSSISQAGYIIAEFLVYMTAQRHREGDVVKAMHGDISDLYVWEKEAVEWLLKHREEIRSINMWTDNILQAVGERRTKLSS